MLDLDDPRWRELGHAYGDGGDIPALLHRLAVEEDDFEGFKVWQQVWGCLCHQATLNTATYAAIPHIVAITKSRPPTRRLMHLAFIGTVAAHAPLPGSRRAQDDLRPAYEEAPRAAETLILESLAEKWDEMSVVVLLASIAAVKGNIAIDLVVSKLHSYI